MTVVERRETPRGELVLRRDGTCYEIVSGGVFLMSTASAGASERLLVRATVAAAGAPPARVLVAGLGVGYSLLEALRSPGVGAVTVVEIEQAVIDWHRTHLRGVTAGALDHPRVRLVRDDLAAHLRALAAGTEPRRDALCLDVDNGPGWTVTPSNEALYTEEGVALLRRAVAPGGAVGVWSAHAAPGFAARLGTRFSSVEDHTVAVARGEPDHVYVASGSR